MNESDFFMWNNGVSVQEGNTTKLTESPTVTTAVSSDSTKQNRDVAGGISNILDNLSKVLFGVSSIKNGQNAQIPTDSILNDRQLELDQPPQRNNTLLFVGLAVVAIIALILFFNKK